MNGKRTKDYQQEKLPAIMVLTIATALLFVSGLAGCTAKVVRNDAGPTLDELLETGARVMWIAAHPDDESFAGAIMAKAGPKYKNPLYFLVLTHGDGGECLLPEGCHPDVATVRAKEIAEVAKLYGATLQLESYFNAPLPVESFPPRQEIAKRWKEKSDPALVIAKAIREFKPDVVLTAAPVHGATGHPEHQLASRFASAGVRLAAQNNDQLSGEPFRVSRMYYLVNKYWIARWLGADDPYTPTELFRVRQSCGENVKCRDMMADNTLPHRTQAADMGRMRFLIRHLKYIYLYRVDPFKEYLDPYEAVAKGGMQ